MPGAVLLPPFSAALTQEAVEASIESYPSDYIIEHILALSSYLIDLVERTNFFGKPGHDPFSPSLHTLYDRLQNGQFGPSSLDSQFLTEERVKARTLERTATPAAQRPLADFEDVYYALVSRIKDIHHLLNMRLKSRFNEVSAPVFEGGPTITDLHDSLSQYWFVLNEPGCGKGLDDAIRREKAETMHREIIFRVQNNELSQTEAEDDIARLWDPHSYSGIQGLWFINGFAPAMIAASLEQKYRVMLRFEREEAEKQARQERRQAKMKKQVKFSRQRAELAGFEQSDHGECLDARRFDGKAHIDVDHQAQKQQQEEVQYPSTHDGVDEGLVQQHLEQERAHQQQLHHALEWQMKSQRVSEYRNYLRNRASQDARQVIRNTVHGNNRMSTFTNPAQDNSNGDTDMGHADA
ncbi:uncharacterized protein K460DRAFT_369862 [Cucurbitaria berberidis CBS 394.84]|uniref:Uncharacterized protein n=1 Tax=Cucurbitaria berberidis CBS 394.84 TaxID=1168544 RepID=A0A9P4GA74_9PLEO|nr:uncharacterized protein K460DRAFT_369862 [Cucurbitaria berberidis CBS 394.84]KAF1841846.1 hypothetical protein K460DRAFT_369862 [Cucurbitaria berberidis CBS 394.84]